MSEPMTSPEAATVADVAALLRAAVLRDHDALRRVVVSLDRREDDLRAIVLHLTTLCATALHNAEGGQPGALAIVDTIAAQARGER